MSLTLIPISREFKLDKTRGKRLFYEMCVILFIAHREFRVLNISGCIEVSVMIYFMEELSLKRLSSFFLLYY